MTEKINLIPIILGTFTLILLIYVIVTFFQAKVGFIQGLKNVRRHTVEAWQDNDKNNVGGD